MQPNSSKNSSSQNTIIDLIARNDEMWFSINPDREHRVRKLYNEEMSELRVTSIEDEFSGVVVINNGELMKIPFQSSFYELENTEENAFRVLDCCFGHIRPAD